MLNLALASLPVGHLLRHRRVVRPPLPYGTTSCGMCMGGGRRFVWESGEDRAKGGHGRSSGVVGEKVLAHICATAVHRVVRSTAPLV